MSPVNLRRLFGHDGHMTVSVFVLEEREGFGTRDKDTPTSIMLLDKTPRLSLTATDTAASAFSASYKQALLSSIAASRSARRLSTLRLVKTIRTSNSPDDAEYDLHLT